MSSKVTWADDDDFWNEPVTTTETADKAKENKPQCPNCGSTFLEHHEASGQTICTECAVVVEENSISFSVEFVENSAGSASMVGQFVSATSRKAYTSGAGGRHGYSRESREVTLANGRRRIQDVASRLRLGSHYIDSAHRLYTIAVEKNFVQGRRSTHVVAACLYIVCRQEKSQHMLIDFSDALQVNVYTLGNCFLKFRRLLGIKLEIIDPALYIYRFAAHLDLNDKANAVALTALRIVSRMKRDWIVAGRRPTGICAAALLISSRAHGFHRESQDVSRILRICGMTVSTRVKEFEFTPSAGLTLDQFHNCEIETEMDPPIFTRNRFKEARTIAIQEGNVALLTSGALDDPRQGKRKEKWRNIDAAKVQKRDEPLQNVYEKLHKEMATDNEDDDASNPNEDDASNPDDHSKTSKATSSSQIVPYTHNKTRSLITFPLGPDRHLTALYPRGNNGKVYVLHNRPSREELLPNNTQVEESFDLDQWKAHMPEHTLKELDDFLLEDHEVAQREAVFDQLHEDYTAKQKEKERERKRAEAAEKADKDEEETQVREKRKYEKRQYNKRKYDDRLSTEEAVLAAVSTRKISRKINYDAMSAIFDDDGGFSTEHLEDRDVAVESDPFACV